MTAAARPTTTTGTADTARNAFAGLSEARLVRADYLVSLADGLITVTDLIKAAHRYDTRALRRITLKQLVLAQPGMGERRARAFLSVVAATLGTREDLGRKTVGWLIDPRAGAKRLACWTAATLPSDLPVSPGFPLAPAPDSAFAPGLFATPGSTPSGSPRSTDPTSTAA